MSLSCIHRTAVCALLLFAGAAACSAHGPQTERVAREQQAIWGGWDDDDTPEANVVVLVGAVFNVEGGCSGTLITPTVVLTANHCITDVDALGFHPVVTVGAHEADELDPGHQFSSNARPALVVRNEPWDTSWTGLDMALVFLDRPVLDLAKIVRPSLDPPTWPGDVDGGLYGGTFGFAGFSPWDKDEQNAVHMSRQAVLFSPIRLEHEPVESAGVTGQEWIKAADKAGINHGDSGGPLFRVRNDAGCAARADCDTRDVMGVASTIHTALTTTTHWTDVTRGWPRAVILDNIVDHTHDAQPNWLRRHPHTVPGTIAGPYGTLVEKWQEQPGAPRWIGEVDYTGPCQKAFDRDCDHWYDEHDNCPDKENTDQAISDDNQPWGDACPAPPPPPLPAPTNCRGWPACDHSVGVMCDWQQPSLELRRPDGSLVTGTTILPSNVASYVYGPSEPGDVTSATYRVCTAGTTPPQCDAQSITVTLDPNLPCATGSAPPLVVDPDTLDVVPGTDIGVQVRTAGNWAYGPDTLFSVDPLPEGVSLSSLGTHSVSGSDPWAILVFSARRDARASTRVVTVSATSGATTYTVPLTIVVDTKCGTITCASQKAGCGPVDDGCGGALDCGACTTGQWCNAGTCVACAPVACAPTDDCGSVPDGCGGTLSCGTCPSGKVCNANHCATCTPLVCGGPGAQCGTVPDGCGGMLSCGGCPTGDVCSGHTCVPKLPGGGGGDGCGKGTCQ